MIKEITRFQDSTVFEGMTSIRAIIKGIDECGNSRRIETILYDKDKATRFNSGDVKFVQLGASFLSKQFEY